MRPDSVHSYSLPAYKKVKEGWWELIGYEPTNADDSFWDMIAYQVPLSQDDLDYIEARHQRFLRNSELNDNWQPLRTN